MNAFDRTFVGRYSGPTRLVLHRVRRSLAAKRNGVATLVLAAPSRLGLEVNARNTKPGKVHVSRKFYIGPRGGLFMVRPSYRRYIKAADIGKGSL